MTEKKLNVPKLAEDEKPKEESLPLSPPSTDKKQKQTKPDSPNLISFKAGAGWIVASVLGGLLVFLVLTGIL